MKFRRCTLAVEGVTVHLRELDAGAVDAIETAPSEYQQALVLLALSLTDPDGAPLYSVDTLDDGVSWVRGLPARVVRDHLIPAATKLNEATLDDARGN